GFSQALVEDYEAALDDEGRETLARIRGAAGRMGQLIDALLLLSRVSRAELAREEIDLSEKARSVLEELGRRDPGRDVEVVIAPGLHASGDRRLLRVVMENLLGNAWKFTGRTPRARIEVST